MYNIHKIVKEKINNLIKFPKKNYVKKITGAIMKIKILLALIIVFSLLSCQKHTLIVESGSGSGEYTSGDTVNIIANSAKIGFKFYRWEGDFQHVKDRFMPNTTVEIIKKSTKLYAVYVSIDETYSLTISDGSGSGEYHPGENVKIFADQITLPKEFYRWNTDCNLQDINITSNDLFKSEIVIKMPRTDIELSAIFDTLYSVLVVRGEGGGKFPKNTLVSIKANPANNGHVFDKWEGDADVLPDPFKDRIQFSMPEMNIELEATYKLEPKYKLEIINGSGSGTYKIGHRQKITANHEPDGQIFTGWIGDTDILYSTNYKTYVITMPARDIYLEATYEKIPDFLVTINNGTGDGLYMYGNTVNINADIKDGFSFSHWEGDTYLLDDSFNPTNTFIMPKKSVVLSAKYKEIENLTVTPVGTSFEDGFFALKAFNNKLFGGAFGYYGKQKIFIYSDNQLTPANPGVIVGESICAFEEFKGMLYANTENRGKMYRTINGNHWEKVKDGPNELGCGLTKHNGYLYALNANYNKAPGHIYRSSDGAHWTKVYDSGSSLAYIREIITFKNTLYVFGSDKHFKTFILSSTNGVNWKKSPTPDRMLRGHIFENKLWLVSAGQASTGQGKGRIWTFDGNNFNKIYESKHTYMGDIISINDKLVAVTSVKWKGHQGGATLVVSCDKGKTWKTAHTFSETEAWALEKFENKIFVGTKQQGGHGQIYKVSGFCANNF